MYILLSSKSSSILVCCLCWHFASENCLGVSENPVKKIMITKVDTASALLLRGYGVVSICRGAWGLACLENVCRGSFYNSIVMRWLFLLEAIVSVFLFPKKSCWRLWCCLCKYNLVCKCKQAIRGNDFFHLIFRFL